MVKISISKQFKKLCSYIDKNKDYKKFYFLLIMLFFMIPPLTSKLYLPQDISKIINIGLGTALINQLSFSYIFFKVLDIIFITSALVNPKKVYKIFMKYISIKFLIIAIVQGISIKNPYNFILVTNDFIVMLLISSVFYKASLKTPEFDLNIKKYWWMFILSIFAFWYPINLTTLSLNCNLEYVLKSPSSLTFCMMAPVYVTTYYLIVKNPDVYLLRIIGCFGIIIGMLNFVTIFSNVQILKYNALFHLPLLIISVYSFFYGFKHNKKTT